jgi:serine/threonine protein kinase
MARKGDGVANSGRWHPVHPSAFPHEQEALELLRDHLPDTSPFRAWSNFEFIAEDGSINEVDALVVSTDRVYLIEIKHWSGTISGNQNSWIVAKPGGRERYEENPLLLANRKAKKLKSLLARQAAFKNSRVPFVQAVVFLSAPQAIVQLDEIASQHIYLRPDGDRRGGPSIIDVIQGRTTEAEGRPPIAREIERAFNRAMDQLGLRQRTRAASVGDYLLTQLIAENDRYQDWEARHARVAGDRKRVRIFPYAQNAAEAEKRERKDIATREYELLREIRHDHILSPGQLTESDSGPALIYDYRPDAQRLDHRLEAASPPLGISQRLDLVRQIAEALAYAHQRGVYHRALSPWTVEVTEKADGRLSACIRDWQSGSSDRQSPSNTRMTLHIGQLAGVIDSPQSAVYSPPEVIAGHGYDPTSIDVFSLGALSYAIFSGQHPATDVEQMLSKCGSGPGLLISEVLDGTPDSLQLLIQSATDPNPADRPSDVRDFLRILDEVENDLTTPERVLGVKPADAKHDDYLTGGFKVRQRLGSGSTCYAMSVERDGQIGVLKIAKDASFNERLRQEAATLRELHHPNIVKCLDLYEIDGLTAIFIEQAGEQTMGQRLRKEGPLSLDLLERFGDELIGTLVYLEREGINHRDLKPENIGIGENRKRALTLKLFDFSLSRAPIDNIRAGTPPYLDPFLSNRRPARWDLHAERFAAGMTLHELATGTLPTWGSAGQDPASSDEEASLDTEKFDASVRDALAAFFAKVLHRDHRQRFDNTDEMYLAWKNVFKHIDQTTLDDSEDDGATDIDLSRIEDLGEATPLSLLGLSPRELNAADRIGATTVGQLLGLHGMRFYRNRGIGQQITRRLRELRDFLAAHLGKATPAEAPDDGVGVLSIDRLVKSLESIKLGDAESSIVNAWLAHGHAEGAANIDLPTQRDVAEWCGSSRSDVQAAIDKAAEKWSKNSWMTALRDEVAEFIQRREGIVTLEELAGRLLSTHGSTATGADRLRQAATVVQSTLETEAGRESARFVLYRGHGVLLVIATDKLGQAFTAPPAERAEYAKALALQANTLAHQDPLPSPRRVEEALAAITMPSGDQPLSPERRLRLAVAAAPSVALSSRLELYPQNMSAERALRLGANTLLGARRLSVAQLHSRIHSRFSHAAPLPDRPALDHLLARIEFPLQWHDATEGVPAGYAMPVQNSGLTKHTSTWRRLTTAIHGSELGTPEAQQAQRFEDTLRRAQADRRVLIVTCALPHLEEAAHALSQRMVIDRLSLDHLLIETLRAQTRQIGADWQVVRQADRATPDSVDWRRLITLVQRAMPQVTQQLLTDPRPLIVQHLGLLVRYGQIGLIQTLRDAAISSPMPTRLLLVPGDSHQAPMLDGAALPVITPADWIHLPKAWLENRHRATPSAAVAGTS